MDAVPRHEEPAGRLQLTGYALAQVLLVVPALLLLVLFLLGGALVVVWVGIGLLLLTVPAIRRVTGLHRDLASRVLGVPVPPAYRPSARGPLQRVTGWSLDPMTWRDAGWLLYAVTLGFALSLLTVLLLGCVVTVVVWWFAAEPLMRARCSLDRLLLTYGRTERLEQRVAALTESRDETVDHSAAELRRIERDLHDGAQARLVALSMNLGMAEDRFAEDPEGARRMVAEARLTSSAVLGELRDVVRGIHPPVLADRGLAGAVEALALDMAIPVRVESRLPGRPPAPVESAVYFAVAECLANVVKHARAESAWIVLEYDAGVLAAVVGDDGVGGVDPGRGTGMRGVMRRLAAFDGTMTVSSPGRGPTVVRLEVPCALSSPRTTPSSGTV